MQQATDQVSVVSAVDFVIGESSVERIGPCAAIDRVIAACCDVLLDTERRNRGRRFSVARDACPGADRRGVAQNQVVAGQTFDPVVAETAQQHIVQSGTDDVVVASPADRSGEADQRVVAVAAVDLDRQFGQN